MRAVEFIIETDTYQPPALSVGDKILKGKFKNSPAEIKGFSKDKHNQPVLKTNKGEVQLFKPRISKLTTEVFEPGKKNWEWLRRGSEEANAQFQVGDREYRWDAFTSRANDKKWEVQFRLIRQHTDPDGLDLFGQTGTGNSAEVLSTAVDITRSFLESYGLDKVEEITFNAKEDSRIGLYAKMIKRLLPSWDLYSKKDPENGMQFTLTDRRAYDKPENKMGEMGEAFNQPYKTKSEKSEYGDIDMLAKLPDGSNLSIMFIQDHDDDGEEVTQVEFWRNNSQEVTGEGDAQRIFATVLAAIQKYIKKHKPQRLSFSASKEVDPSTYYGPDDVVPNPESRAKLYDRLVQRYAKAWGYRAFRADTGKLVRYELSRLQPAVAEDISRRGFLGGLAGTAVGLAATDAEAGKKKSAAHDKNAKAMNTKIDPKYQLAPGDDLPVLSNNPRVEIAVQKAAKAHGITQPAELAQFMAQTNHESWDFSKLFQVGDKRVYGGKGLIQLTGKNNYAAASKYAGVDLVKHPEQAAKLDVALKVAIWFWKQEVRRYAKTPEHFLNTKLITRIVNGPDMNGLQDREEKFKRYLSIL